MGGRGASSGGFAGGGISGNDIVSTTSLISARERYESEVDMTLSVLRDVQKQYGVDVSDVQLATLKGRGNRALAYYDNGGNLAVNKNFFNSEKMDKVMDKSIAQGFHPPRGNKSGIEAVAAHEMGHRLTEEAGVRAGLGAWQLDKVASRIVRDARKESGAKTVSALRKKISGYATQDNAEAVAEAFADVYCNGKKASKASRAVVNALNKYF